MANTNGLLQRDFPYKTHDLMIITLKICNKLQFLLSLAYFPDFYPLVTLKIRFWWLIPMDYYKNNQRSSLQRDLADKHHDMRLQILKIKRRIKKYLRFSFPYVFLYISASHCLRPCKGEAEINISPRKQQSQHRFP